VYFATYEAVKHAMGGNQAGVHHPLAAGQFCPHDTGFISLPEARTLTDFIYETATSGAAATIASDAFMNPFDGTLERALLLICPSHPRKNIV
jgi:solute carrier family 25 iron transporter 28/37